jgi:NAD(P)-dependent dehydrogenase (short-subunit alcohol dehydrogenase family)
MSLERSLAGKIAVVTGGASGIGLACCRELAAEHAQIVVLDRNLEAAQKAADDVGGVAWRCDIAVEEDVAAAASRIEAEIGAVSILVNSAGVVQGRLDPHSMPQSKWDAVVRIDQRGVYVACVAFARAMLERRRGAIVNIASVAGMRSLPLHAYAPAKAAVIAMTETLAAEWGGRGVRVNAVSPGFTRTNGMLAAIASAAMDEAAMAAPAALRRLVEPSEVAAAVAFLASERAAAITGANLPVDCGWLAGAAWGAYGGLPENG